MKPGTCKHFNGIQNKVCRVGIAYADVTLDHALIWMEHGGACTKSMPCLKDANRGGAICDRYEEPTTEDIAARQAEIDRAMDCLARGVSKCCEAPIDERRVIASGHYKGHGPRYCSKCGRLQFLV